MRRRRRIGAEPYEVAAETSEGGTEDVTDDGAPDVRGPPGAPGLRPFATETCGVGVPATSDRASTVADRGVANVKIRNLGTPVRLTAPS
jgi:hypothetical protein